jgi:hypothetical protein
VGSPIFQVPPLPSVYSLTRSAEVSYTVSEAILPLGSVTTESWSAWVTPAAQCDSTL